MAGLVTLNILPIAQYPEITPPTVQVSAVYPGADAQTVAQTVGLPIEQQVNGVDGMLYMSSNSSSSGAYSLTITFAVGTDIDMATVMVQNRVSIAQSSLPEAVIVQGITTIVAHPEKARMEVAEIPAVIYNIGHGSPIKLLDFIHLLEKQLGKAAQKEYVGMQPGDVYQTWADTTRLKEDYQYIPTTSLEEGIKKFADWYKAYYT